MTSIPESSFFSGVYDLMMMMAAYFDEEPSEGQIEDRMELLSLDFDMPSVLSPELVAHCKLGEAAELFAIVRKDEWNATAGAFQLRCRRIYQIRVESFEAIFPQSLIRAHRDTHLDRYGRRLAGYGESIVDEDHLLVYIRPANLQSTQTAHRLVSDKFGPILLVTIHKSVDPYATIALACNPATVRIAIDIEALEQTYLKNAKQVGVFSAIFSEPPPF